MEKQDGSKNMELEKAIIKFLKKCGCAVDKTQNGSIFFCKEGFYGFIETKRSKNAPLRPGQKQFIEKMNGWSYGRVCYPENWPQVQKELTEILK